MADSPKTQLARAQARVAELERQLEAAQGADRLKELELQNLRAQLARPRLVPLPAAPVQPQVARGVRPMDEPGATPPAPTAEELELAALEQEIAERKRARGS